MDTDKIRILKNGIRASLACTALPFVSLIKISVFVLVQVWQSVGEVHTDTVALSVV